MFTVAWWYILATWGAVWAGLLVDPAWFYAAIGLCAVQALHFGIEDKNFFSLSCQVRYAMAGIFALGLVEPLRWICWIPAVGMTARLTLNYCLLARLVSLLPWNRPEPVTWATVKCTIFSAPVRDCILKKS